MTTIEIEPNVDLTSSILQGLLIALKEMDQVVALDRVEFNQVGQSYIYDYRIILEDGRNWIQSLDFSGKTTDPVMTFDVDEPWKLSEFVPHRAVRESMIDAYNRLGVSKLIVRFK